MVGGAIFRRQVIPGEISRVLVLNLCGEHDGAESTDDRSLPVTPPSFLSRVGQPRSNCQGQELRDRQGNPTGPSCSSRLSYSAFSAAFLAAGFGWSGIGFTFVSSTGAVVLASGKVAPAGTIHCSEVAVPAFPVRVSMRLGSTFCFASPPEMYAFTSTARSPARFLRLSFGPAFPTTTSLASESLCKLSATSSSAALHVLSTRHGLLTLGYAHSFTLNLVKIAQTSLLRAGEFQIGKARLEGRLFPSQHDMRVGTLTGSVSRVYFLT